MINFKLIINGQKINYFEKTKHGFLFEINGIRKNMKQISKECTINVLCEDCMSKSTIKNLQQLIKRNKPYLCKSCRTKGERNGMFLKKHTESTILKMKQNNAGDKNPFFNKKHSEEAKKKQSESKKGLYEGYKNPMYQKSVFDIWVKKYGFDKAFNMWEEKKVSHSKKMQGQNNPMSRKNIIDVWKEKYNEDKVEELYRKWKSQIKNSLKLFYANNSEIKRNISDKLKNRVFSDTHRKNLRVASIKYIEKKLQFTNGKMTPHFNIDACELFDKIAEIKKIKIQHALNGGEFYIKALGYWVDGFDSKNNVVYEYYEKYHKYKRDKDLFRELQIKNFLNCDFVIINEGEEEIFLNKIKKNEI